METRPFASLTASLLARKGAARPAMRRPLSSSLPVPTLPLSVQEDLGWNDMGEDHDDLGPVAVPSPVDDAVPLVTESAARAAPHEQQARLAEALSAVRPASEDSAAKDVPVGKARITITPLPVRTAKQASQARAVAKIPPVKAGKATIGALQPRQTKAAFTLRLDPDRHLRLRLACALSGHSAQQIVTQALDDFLAAQPDLDAFAKQLASGTLSKAEPKGRAKGRKRSVKDS